MKTNKDFFPTQGEVIERINKKQFRVKCDNGKIINAHVVNRFRDEQGRRRTKIVVGDRVVIEITLSDLEEGSIVSFAKNV